MSDSLPAYIASRCALVDEGLKSFLPGESDFPESLHRAMHYSLFAGGKRLRPLLVMAACEAVGGDIRTVLPAACAMEMIHTYSLIHDDLPAMDDDDFRRGYPTSHKMFGEAMAILAGDALLTQAFILMSDPRYLAGHPPERALAAIAEFANCAGSRGMVGGQVVDMESEGGREIDLSTLQYIHIHKTGALIKASVKVGALLGGADDTALASLVRYGESIGLAFQIADDILDREGTTEQLGKPAGSDQKRGKATYPALVGIGEARRRAAELLDLALDQIAPFDDKAGPLRDLARYVITRKS